MKVIKQIFSWLATILIIGGLVVIGFTYITNKNLFAVLLSNSIVKGSFSVLKRMLFGALAVLAGMIALIISMKIGGVVRRKEREKRAQEKQYRVEAEEQARQLRLEAEEAKAEAERVRKEAEAERDRYIQQQQETKTEE